jgi:hypothetical protein
MSLINIAHPYLDPEEEIVQKTMLRAAFDPAIQPVLRASYAHSKIDKIAQDSWSRYDEILPTISKKEKFPPGPLAVLRLGVFVISLHNSLIAAGETKEKTHEFALDILWKVVEGMSEPLWTMSASVGPDPYLRMKWYLDNFINHGLFDHNVYGWEWKDPDPDKKTVRFLNHRCHLAEFFHSHNIVEACDATFCALDFRIAHMLNADLIEPQNIAKVLAGGKYKNHPKYCDFNYVCRE